MSWPTPQEYNEAVQNPHYNFTDAELQHGDIQTNEFGLPRVASGSFASVYRAKCAQREVAVRCFLRDTPNQQERYELISWALAQVKKESDLPEIVGFQYLRDGIRVAGHWYPILKMEWINGQPLDLYVKENAHDKQSLLQLAKNFKTMVTSLNQVGIAHGDLQHGNILVSAEGKCQLVDYDGMFVPALKDHEAHELGHRNYQHPARDHSHFNANLDNFSAWSIYTALICLAEDPDLMNRLQACDECLLFKQTDYKFPLRSLTFFTLEAHDSLLIRSATRTFRSLLDRSLDDIPRLSEEIETPDTLPDLTSVFSALPAAPKKTSSYAVESVVELTEERRGRPAYPRLIDYIPAISNPAKCCNDEELKASILALDHGQIRGLTGERGAVFRFHAPGGADLAVKVYFQPDAQREERYHIFKEFVDSDPSEMKRLEPYLVQFDYQREGVRVNNTWYPITIMEWINGPTLFAAVDNAVSKGKRDVLRRLAREFKTLMAALRQAGIVHGDIDAENLIVTRDGLRLIDYDLVRTPRSMQVAIGELSNKHFRHPKTNTHKAENNDNFSAWIVYTSLIVLSIQPDLWNQAGIKPGRFLFRGRDLRNPAESLVFNLLENHYSHVVRSLASQLKMFALWDPEHVPMVFDEQNEDQDESSERDKSSTKSKAIISADTKSRSKVTAIVTHDATTLSAQTKLIIGIGAAVSVAAIVYHAWFLLLITVFLMGGITWLSNKE